MDEIGYCGDNCSSCPRYIATATNDFEKLKEAAQMWKRVGWRDTVLSSDEIKCGGCKTVNWCRYNDIRECAIGRELNNCGECNQYPCDRTHMFLSKQILMPKNAKQFFQNKILILFQTRFLLKRLI